MINFKITESILKSLAEEHQVANPEDFVGMCRKRIKPWIDDLKTQKRTIRLFLKQKGLSLDVIEDEKEKLNTVCEKLGVLLECYRMSKVAYA